MMKHINFKMMRNVINTANWNFQLLFAASAVRKHSHHVTD